MASHPLCLDLELMGAMDDFSGLYLASQNQRRCDKFEVDLMRRVAENTQAHRFYGYQATLQLNRLYYVANQAFNTHARFCFPKYRLNFRRSYRTLGGQTRTVVEGLMTSLLGSDTESSPHSIPYLSWLLTKEPLDFNKDTQLTFEYVERISQGDDSRQVPHRLYAKYIAAPCREYCRVLEELMEPVIFDMVMFDTPTSAFPLDDADMSPFITSIASYKTCKAIVESNESEFKAALMNMLVYL